MKQSIKRGLGFGITSGVITTIGLMIGLYSSTNSKLAILGGIITIAIADALSDSLGIHISEESVNKNKKRIWQSTFSTFIFKFLTAIIFVIAILIFPLKIGILINLILGIIILTLFSYKIAKNQKEKPLKIITEHLSIAILVIIITFFLGKLISHIGLI